MSAEPSPPGLEGYQAEIAEVALRAIGRDGFALAGAGALVAHGVLSRPTQDLTCLVPPRAAQDRSVSRCGPH